MCARPTKQAAEKRVRDQGNGTRAGRRWAAACVAAAFLRNCWQSRRIRSSPFGDLRPTGYCRRFCWHFSAASKVGASTETPVPFPRSPRHTKNQRFPQLSAASLSRCSHLSLLGQSVSEAPHAHHSQVLVKGFTLQERMVFYKLPDRRAYQPLILKNLRRSAEYEVEPRTFVFGLAVRPSRPTSFIELEMSALGA